MHFTELYHRLQSDLLLHSHQYKFFVETATVAVLFYVGLTDFRTFKIRNDVLLLLIVLYFMYALVARSWSEILFDVLLSAAIFSVLLWFYTKRVVGGGDVKFVAVACLWVGLHCAPLFSVLLLLLLGLHLIAVKARLAATKTMAGGKGIPYAPAVAGALIGAIVLGCL
jgi:prepilin peptidase CpaA